MPADFWSGLWSMLEAAAIVASVVLPVGIVAWLFVRRRQERLLPPWRPWRAPWGGFEVVLTVVVIYILIPNTVATILASSGMPTGNPSPAIPAAAIGGVPAATALGLPRVALDRIVWNLWTGVVALPLQLSLLVGVGRFLYPSWWLTPRLSFAARIAQAVSAWLVFTPLVLAANGMVNIIFTLLHWPVEAHVLTRMAGQSGLLAALLLVQACVAAPAIEEILFRGVILLWAIGGRKPVPSPGLSARIRPWLVMLMAIALAAKTTGGAGDRADDIAADYATRFGPLAFALLLAGGLAVVIRIWRAKQRIVGAVYSSAALFALLHADFWPTPIPLFLLGLGLGWIAVRTRSLLVPILVHGLFNAVSAVYVLRSPG